MHIAAESRQRRTPAVEAGVLGAYPRHACRRLQGLCRGRQVERGTYAGVPPHRRASTQPRRSHSDRPPRRSPGRIRAIEMSPERSSACGAPGGECARPGCWPNVAPQPLRRCRRCSQVRPRWSRTVTRPSARSPISDSNRSRWRPKGIRPSAGLPTDRPERPPNLDRRFAWRVPAQPYLRWDPQRLLDRSQVRRAPDRGPRLPNLCDRGHVEHRGVGVPPSPVVRGRTDVH